MTKNIQYFLISLTHLPDKQEIFSFNLYIFNPINSKYSLFLNANSPLTINKREFLRLLESKAGSVAIDFSQKKTFLASTNQQAKDVPGLIPYEKHPLEKAREIYLHQYAQKQEKIEQEELPPFIRKNEIKRSILSNDFSNLISEVRDEVLTFPLDISQTVSLAIELCEELLIIDNKTNKIVALSFLLAKELKITDISSLSEIICTAFLFHLGFTQLNRSLIKIPYMQLPEKSKSYYRRHAGLTQHLLKKIQLPISDETLNSILQHHERIDGNGYPYMKSEKSITLPSQIIGIVSHIFDHAQGKTSGQTLAIQSVISQIVSGTNSPGLEKNFPTSIIEVLESIQKIGKEQLDTEGDSNGLKS